MPKTRDAFAFKKLYDNLYMANGFEYVPTYENRPDNGIPDENDIDNPYLHSRDYYVEKVLLNYLDSNFDAIKFDKTQKNKVYLIAIWQKVVSRFKKWRLKNFELSVRIERHITKLQNYSNLIFDKVLSEGLSDRLQEKGLRVKFLISRYEYMLRVFDGYEPVLIADLRAAIDLSEAACRKVFGDRLRQARIAKNISIADMASMLGLTRAGYGNYELGKRDLPTPTIYRLAKILDVSLDWLFGLKD